MSNPDKTGDLLKKDELLELFLRVVESKRKKTGPPNIFRDDFIDAIRKADIRSTRDTEITENMINRTADDWVKKGIIRKGGGVWRLLKPELLKSAQTDRPDNTQFCYPEEILGNFEGHAEKVLVNKYERNTSNRKRCIARWKATCYICAFDFSKNYGKLGKDYIHVHHIVPLSELSEAYQVVPEKDLIPVCPNCHAMLHAKTNDPEKEKILDMLKKQIDKNKNRKEKNLPIQPWKPIHRQ